MTRLSTYIKRLKTLREQYNLPEEMDTHLKDIITQAQDSETPRENENMLATRLQRFYTYLMEDYRDDYDNSESVRDECVDIYADIAETERPPSE